MYSFDLYVFSDVIIHLNNGTEQQGKMTSFSEDAVVLDGEFSIPVAEIIDVEYKGIISDYQTYHRRGRIGEFFFDLSALSPEFDKDMLLYNEYICRVACHLNDVGGIHATDIRMISFEHKRNDTLQAKESFIYRYNDGRTLAGKLIDNGVIVSHKSHIRQLFTMLGVESIWRTPHVGEYVIVSLSDGSCKEGIVKAIDDDQFLIRNENAPSFISYNSITQLRTKGKAFSTQGPQGTYISIEVTNASSDTVTTFICKKPYLRNIDERERPYAGEELSFIPGMNDRGLIAKDAIIVDGAAETRFYEGVGIILNYKTENNKSVGYIGDEFCHPAYNRDVLKAASLPIGFVRFGKIDFSFDVTNIYVVSYTCKSKPDAEHKMDNIGKLKVIRTLAKKDYAYVRVLEDGNISTITASTAFIPYYLERARSSIPPKPVEMEVSYEDGHREHGIAIGCDNQTLTLLTPAKTLTISTSEIASVRYYETITSRLASREGLYDRGYTNNGIFFHVNDLRDAVDKIQFSNSNVVGSTLSYMLTLSPKGNGLAAVDATIHTEAHKRCFLSSWENNLVCLTASQTAEGRLTRKKYPLEIIRESIDVEQLHAELENYEIGVDCILRQRGESTVAILTGLSGNRIDKNENGFITFYNLQRGFCFITPAAFINEKKADWRRRLSQDIYYAPSSPLSFEGSALDTFQNYYEISYRKDSLGRVETISVVKKLPKVVSNHEIVNTDLVQESIDLGQEIQANRDIYDGAQWETGFVSLASARFGVINKAYFNKHFADRQDLQAADTLPVLFDPSRAKILGLDAVRFKTAKSTYCVRYVPKGTAINEATGVEQPTIDYEYPIEVLREFNKASYACITQTSDHMLQCQKRSSDSENCMSSISELRSFPLMPHENVYLTLENGTNVFDSVKKAEESGIVLQSAGIIPYSRISAIYRFGVVTDFSEDENLGEINGTTTFSLNVLEKASYNILKSQTGGAVRLHVIYRYDNDTITEVFSCTEDVKKLLRASQINENQGQIVSDIKRRIPWVKGLATGIDSAGREVIVDGYCHHFITVRSDAQTSIRFRNGTIKDDEVYFKAVSHPFLPEGGSEPELYFSAFDLICYKERVTLRFLSSVNQYYGYRNQTDYFPINGIDGKQSKLLNQEVDIEWRLIDENIRLEARIFGTEAEDVKQKDAEEELDDLFVMENIRKHPVFLYWRSKVSLTSIPALESTIKMDETGIPTNIQMAEEAIRILYYESRSQKFDSTIALIHLALLYPNANIPDVRSDRDAWINKMIHNLFRSKAKNSPDINNLSFGEANYYLSVLIANAAHNPSGPARALRSWDSCMYRLFAADFLNSMELRNVYNPRSNLPEGAGWKPLLSGGEITEERRLQNFISQLLLLDRGSAESAFACISGNGKLLRQLSEYIDRYSLRTGAESDVVSILREKYRDFRRYHEARVHAILSSPENEFIRELLVWLTDLQVSFCHLVCAEDSARFKELLGLCSRFSRYNFNYIGFREQNQELRDIERLFTELEKAICEHPCRDSFELLSVIRSSDQNNLLSRFRKELDRAQKKLYQDSKPIILIEPITQSVEPGEQTLQFAIHNNIENQKTCQPALNIRVELESLTLGIRVGEIKLFDRATLNSGECEELQVPFSVNIDEALATNIMIRVQWSVLYDYVDDVDGHTHYTQGSDAGIIELQLTTNVTHFKKTSGTSPYEKAAKGDPLSAEDVVFVGRKKELRDIKDAILQASDGKLRFVHGATVLLYGQRKCGKTSFVNKLIGEIISNPVLREQAIIISFSDFSTKMGQITSLADFRKKQYREILKSYRMEVHDNHPVLWQRLETAQMLPPTSPEVNKMTADEVEDFFNEYFTWFNNWDKGEHAVIILADEYSRIPVRILQRRDLDYQSFIRNQLIDIPSFVRSFSVDLGFVQVFIGHYSMIRSLRELGTWNHTGEFAKVIKLAELEDEEARELITRPVQSVQGYNPYESPLGEAAIRSLLRLSGNMPVFLVRLCNKVYYDFIDKNHPEKWISERGNVQRAVASLLDEKDPKLFDVLYNEDDDDTGLTEDRETYRYLESAARCALRSSNNRSADESAIRLDLRNRYGDVFPDDRFNHVRDLLVSRGVIEFGKGQVAIKSQLFLEYIKRREG